MNNIGIKILKIVSLSLAIYSIIEIVKKRNINAGEGKIITNIKAGEGKGLKEKKL